MAEILTAEVLSAAFGLLTVIMTGLFALTRQKYSEAAKQGDVLLSAAKKTWDLVKAVYGSKAGYASYIAKGDELLKALEKGWEDSKVRTPDMEDYYSQLMALAVEIGKVQV
ncbi:MAG: hypothetical protein A4E30_00326 [Methanomassiliicoccales archaeon PtaB.Bin215]|nr:MAG: hypothetical protein A4E30_00326 [Methanomassiliicoccales archaeon PtaB.Bin215]